MEWDAQQRTLRGPGGTLVVAGDDEVTVKLLMLIEGECKGLGVAKASQKYGYSRERYRQLRNAFHEQGARALASKPRGPRRKSVSTHEAIRQIIRHAFLDPQASAEVIAQKLQQTGCEISIRSVQRVLEDFGMGKKFAPLYSQRPTAADPRDADQPATRGAAAL